MFINFDNIGFFAGEPSLSLSFSPLEFFLEVDSSSSSSVVTRLSVSSSWSLFLNSQFCAMVRLSTFCAKAEAENFLLDGLSMVLPGSWLCTSSRSIRKICPESAEDDLSASLSRVSSSLPSYSQTCNKPMLDDVQNREFITLSTISTHKFHILRIYNEAVIKISVW